VDLTELHDELQEVWTELKTRLEAAEAEAKKLGDETGETKTVIERLQDKLDEVETKLQRPPVGDDEPEQLESKAFGEWLRKGHLPEEYKATLLATDDEVRGGIWIPENIRTNIITRIVDTSPVRELATVETISQGNTLTFPRQSSTRFACGWIGERASVTQTNVATMEAETIPVHEMYAEPFTTQQLLEDAAYDVEGWMQRELAREFGFLEATAFVSGTSIGQPEGLLTNADVAHTAAGSTSVISADCLIDLQMSLQEPYQANATWLAKRTTIRDWRKLKDGQGRYIWEPSSIAAGYPATLLGRPYREAADMPAATSALFPVLYGDFRAAYVIVDRTGMTTLRDPYTNKPFVVYYTRRRVGGQVVAPWAIKKLEMATS